MNRWIFEYRLQPREGKRNFSVDNNLIPEPHARHRIIPPNNPETATLGSVEYNTYESLPQRKVNCASGGQENRYVVSGAGLWVR